MIIKNHKGQLKCELTSASEIGEAEKVLREFYFNEYKDIDPKLVPHIAGRKDENLVKKQTEIAFVNYFETHVGDGLNIKMSERDAIYEALTNRVTEMEEEI